MNFAAFRDGTCRRTAPGRASVLHRAVQRARRQRAARAAPPLPHRQRCAPHARLAAGRSRERMREAETEGKIKGAARLGLPSQSARGFDAARHLAVPVPRRQSAPPAVKDVRAQCAAPRWSLRDGVA